MATITLSSHALDVRFTRTEKLTGLLRDIEVPLSSVRGASVEPDGVRAAQGLRAPGLAIPGRRKVGTWRGRGSRSAVCVKAGEPALRITLTGSRWGQLLIGHPNAADLAAQLSARTVG